MIRKNRDETQPAAGVEMRRRAMLAFEMSARFEGLEQAVQALEPDPEGVYVCVGHSLDGCVIAQLFAAAGCADAAAQVASSVMGSSRVRVWRVRPVTRSVEVSIEGRIWRIFAARGAGAALCPLALATRSWRVN